MHGFRRKSLGYDNAFPPASYARAFDVGSGFGTVTQYKRVPNLREALYRSDKARSTTVG
jgi:hypothetical protein